MFCFPFLSSLGATGELVNALDANGSEGTENQFSRVGYLGLARGPFFYTAVQHPAKYRSWPHPVLR